MNDYEIVERNLRAAMAVFALSGNAGETREMPGVVIASTGMNHAMFNSAMLTSPVPGSHGDLDRRIAMAQVHFAARGLRWSFWLCEDLLDRSTRRRAEAVFNQRGLRAVTHPPGMMAGHLSQPVRELPSLEFRPIADESTRLAFCQVTSEAFELALPSSRDIYDHEQVWTQGFSGWVGFLEDIPVTTAATIATPDAIGVYSVATRFQYRRRGFGEALLRHAVSWESARTGIARSVLQTTRAGQGLYERMGFRAVTRFAVFS